MLQYDMRYIKMYPEEKNMAKKYQNGVGLSSSKEQDDLQLH